MTVKTKEYIEERVKKIAKLNPERQEILDKLDELRNKIHNMPQEEYDDFEFFFFWVDEEFRPEGSMHASERTSRILIDMIFGKDEFIYKDLILEMMRQDILGHSE